MDAKTQFRRRSEPTPLADALVKMMEPRHTGISQRYEAASQLSEVWAQLLPPEMVQHCRVVDLSAGQLTVEVDSPSYMYELRISSHQLVEHLRLRCPQAKLRAIKITLAG